MEKVVENFHKYFYKNWKKNSWMGTNCVQYPTDMLLMQQLIFKYKPDFIIETGTNVGGSAFYYASLCEIMKHGKVITVDKDDKIDKNSFNYKSSYRHRIQFIHGKSIDADVIEKIREKVRPLHKVIVLLDSLHRAQYVGKEMDIYRQFVPLYGYMIVQDTDIGGHPVWPEYGDGPFEAVHRFLEKNDNFVIDKELEERFFLTCAPSGHLKRVK